MPRLHLLPTLLLVVAACGSSADSGPPTYNRDIKPLIERECLGCHSPGNIAPFPLTTYADVVEQQDFIEPAIRARIMPPSPVDVSGACQTYSAPAYLTDAEIERFADWVAAGSLEGDPEAAPLPPPVPEPLVYDVERRPEVVYSSQSTGTDDYRCFVLEPLAATDRYVTAADFVPGDPAIVHHVLLFANAEQAEDDEALALDAADAGPGYTCFGTAGENVGSILVATWAPGSLPRALGDDRGVLIPAGRRLVMQVHYNFSAGVAPDQTAVKLRTTDRASNETIAALIDDQLLELPPGRAETTYSWELGVERDLEVPFAVQMRAAFPHMHTLGRSARLERVRQDGSTECLMDVPRWDFHWQRTYDYEQPIQLDPTDALRLTCNYDTRERNQPVAWGERTEDEMCLIGLDITLR